MCLLEELVSPIVTPLILISRMRHKSLDIVDFLRSFTVDVAGVGDVCSFAQLDVKRHGHPDVCCCQRNHDILIICGQGFCQLSITMLPVISYQELVVVKYVLIILLECDMSVELTVVVW